MVGYLNYKSHVSTPTLSNTMELNYYIREIPQKLINSIYDTCAIISYLYLRISYIINYVHISNDDFSKNNKKKNVVQHNKISDISKTNENFR